VGGDEDESEKRAGALGRGCEPAQFRDRVGPAYGFDDLSFSFVPFLASIP
jgi:hypothetical protein